MIKVALAKDPKESSVSFYRMSGVWPLLGESHIDIEVVTLNEFSVSNAYLYDVLVLNRPCTPQVTDVLCHSKRLGKKIIIDLDDDLFSVPVWNSTHMYYKGTAKVIEENLKLADKITVSTPNLRDSLVKRLPELQSRIVVIPNAWNDYVFGADVEPLIMGEGMFNVCWRGSATHIFDLEVWRQAFIALAKAGSSCNFYGYLPALAYDMTRARINSVQYTPEASFDKYFETLKKDNAKVLLVPLIYDDFNLAKSNCAWLEGTMSGKAVISSNLPEFTESPGCIALAEGELPQILDRFVKEPKLLEEYHKMSVEFIKKNLLLSQVNELRAELLEEMFE